MCRSTARKTAMSAEEANNKCARQQNKDCQQQGFVYLPAVTSEVEPIVPAGHTQDAVLSKVEGNQVMCSIRSATMKSELVRLRKPQGRLRASNACATASRIFLRLANSAASLLTPLGFSALKMKA
eukprot:6181144-Pleurochrysis_carterae.AAC.3